LESYNEGGFRPKFGINVLLLCLIFGSLLRIVEKMKIRSPFRAENIPFIGSFLLIIPLDRPAQAIDAELGLQI
jgi:hypothetical protein